ADRRYMLSAEHAQVLLDRDAPTYFGAYPRMFVAATQQLPALMKAYREGGGDGWREDGKDMSEGQEFGNRPTYINAVADWFAAIPHVHAKLSAGGRPLRVGGVGRTSMILVPPVQPVTRARRIHPAR